MLKVTLKGLSGRKIRAVLTGLAIVLGVAMMSGTFVLTDTINNAFTSIFTQSYKNADAIISGKTAFRNDQGNGVQAPSFPESVLANVRALPDVKAAEGSVNDDRTQLVGHDGKVLTTHGAPSLAGSVDPKGDQRFNPLQLTQGRWPNGPHEIAIDSSTASSKHYGLGDTIGVEKNGPVQRFRIVGVVKLPGVSIGSATISVFDVPTLQKLLGRVGKLDLIRVQAKAGVATSKLIDEIKPLLPAAAQVRDA